MRNSTDTTPMNRWLPRIVGTALAILFLGASIFPVGVIFPIPGIAEWIGILAVIVIAFFWKGIGGVIFVRWWARIVGVVSAALLAYIFIAESVGGQGPPMTTLFEWVLVSMGVAILVGIVIAFFWEGIGGLIVALAALTWQGWLIVQAGAGFNLSMLNPVYMVFVFVGLAFVSCWWRTRRLSSTLTQSVA